MSSNLNIFSNTAKSSVWRENHRNRFGVRCYKFSQNCLRRLTVFHYICFNGFWLGILSPKTLSDIDEIYYTDGGMYFDEKYNAQGLFNWEKIKIENYFKNRQNIMLLAAGGGREAYGLQKMGYKVDAFECHPMLLKFANKFLAENQLTPCVYHVERDGCPVSDKKYDGAIVGWGAYMLVQSREKRIELLRRIREQLKPDSPVLISFFIRKNSNSKILRGTAFVGNVFRFALGRKSLEVGDCLDPTFVHFFIREEIESELKEAGYKLEFFSAKPYGHAIGIVQTNIVDSSSYGELSQSEAAKILS